MTKLLKDKTILIVDDDADVLDLLRLALENAGADVIGAESVETAMKSYRQSPPHAVVADIRLGKSDGYALLKTIRETNIEYRGVTAVIAVTGYASPQDEEKAYAAGFDAYISKPFEPDEVVHRLGDLLS